MLETGDGMFSRTKIEEFSQDLSNLVNGGNMFWECQDLIKFEGDLSSLENGHGAFGGCLKLKSFISDLPLLADAEGMFEGCALDGQSVERILTSIPRQVDWRTFSLGMNREGCDKFVEIVGLTSEDLELISDRNNGHSQAIYKGWMFEISCSDGDYILPTSPTANFDVSEANGYIPDASGWRYEVYEPNQLTITRVTNGEAFNDNN